MRTDSERLAVVETIVKDLHHTLLGNGQPGKIEQHERRIAKLENWRWWVLGILFGLGVALGAGGQHIIEAMGK